MSPEVCDSSNRSDESPDDGLFESAVVHDLTVHGGFIPQDNSADGILVFCTSLFLLVYVIRS